MIRFDVHKVFRQSGVDFKFEMKEEITGGSITGLSGPSGSGKTTLLRFIAGLEKFEGELVCNEVVWSKNKTNAVDPSARKIGFVFQDHALFPHMSVIRNVEFATKQPDSAYIADLFARLELDDVRDSMPHQLSGGQKQRVALVRALAPKPELLLLDEPFASVEERMRSRIVEVIRHHHQENGSTILIASHHDHQLKDLCSRILFINNGRVIESRNYSSLSQDHDHGFIEEIQLEEKTALVKVKKGEDRLELRLPVSMLEGVQRGDKLQLDILKDQN